MRILCTCLAALTVSYSHIVLAAASPELRTRLEKNEYDARQSVSLNYTLEDGSLFPFRKGHVDYFVGLPRYFSNYTGGAAPGLSVYSLSDEALFKKLPGPSKSVFSFPAKAVPFRDAFHRHMGFTNHEHLLIRRELMPPPGLIRSDQAVYELGDPIRLTVSDEVAFLIEEQWLTKDSAERPHIEIWRAPREVPGGAVELPKRFLRSEHAGMLASKDEAFTGYTLTLDSLDGYMSVHDSNHGYLPIGHYHVLLKIRETIIGEIPGGIEVIGPQRESVSALMLEPALDEDEHNEQGVPVYDELPTLKVNHTLKELYKQQGSVGIYYVGAGGARREVSYHYTSSGVPLEKQLLLSAFTTGGLGSPPGEYEARYYFGGKNNPFNGQLLLQTVRFKLTAKALEGNNYPREKWATLPSDTFTIRANGNGPYHIGEMVELELAQNDELSDEAETLLKHSNLYLMLRRLGQYHANCAYHEERAESTMQRFHKGTPRPTKGPLGTDLGIFAIPDIPQDLPFKSQELEIPQILAVVDESGNVQDWQKAPVKQTRHDHNTPRVSYQDNGRIRINPPDVPGRYALDIYRLDALNHPMPAYKFPDAQRVTRFEFDVVANEFKGLVDANGNNTSIAPQLRGSDAVIAHYHARHQLPGVVKSYMGASDSETITGPLNAARPTHSHAPHGKFGAIADYGVYRVMLNNYILSEASPKLMDTERSLRNWAEQSDDWFAQYYPQTPNNWPEHFRSTPISWRDLVIPQEQWLLPKEACYNEPLPSFTLRLVRLDGAEQVDKQEEWLNETYGVIDFEAMEYEEIDDPYIGYPFFIEAEFNDAPSADKVRASASVAGIEAHDIWLIRSEDEPTIYRSERAYHLGAQTQE